MLNKKDYPRGILKFFWQILKPYKWWLILMFQAPIIGAFFIPVNNYSLKLIIDKISQIENFSLHDIIFPVVLYCAASIILEIAWRFANYADYKSQPKIEAEIINKSYEMLLSHNYLFFQNNLSGKIASKINVLRDKYVAILDNFQFGIVWRSVTVFISLAIFFTVHFELALVVAAWLIIFMPLMFLIKKKGVTYSQITANDKQKISGLINDGISNIANILFFCGKKFELNLIKKANAGFIANEKRRLKFIFLNHLVIGFIYSALSIAVLFLLIDLRRRNLISIGDFVMVMGLMYNVIEATWGLLNDSDSLIQDFGHLKEAFVIFKQGHEIYDDEKSSEVIIKNPQIIFKNLYFKYGENPVFENFNLNIKAGEKIGLVGYSGAGKSTLINLLLKVFSLNSGEIFIEGKNISDITFDSLRANISLIPQDPMLFHRSIFENIAYGKLNASKSEVIAASKKAYIHDFILSLPNGYETLVGERGIKLSGGQRQRIAIARAILKNAPILILDEATSSLDSETESQLQFSLNQMFENQNISVIAIAHRLSTIKHMDRIIVLEEGRIIEEGNFSQLVAKENGRFRELWSHQVQGMII